MNVPWDLGACPTLARPLPESMHALTLCRDRYGPPSEAVRCEQVPVPRLALADANRVLVSILATGANFNTNFASLGLPAPVFGRGDSATLHIPGSDALGIVVDAGPAVTSVSVGQAVILDSWTGQSIRGYETHDGFNAQFAVVDEERAIPVPPALREFSPERLGGVMLTYGTAYRATVERLDVGPGDSLLVMGGGKGTSFAAVQLGKAAGAHVILVGSNPSLAQTIIERGLADAFINRHEVPKDVFGVVPTDESYEDWCTRTEPFRQAVLDANGGRPVDKVFDHTGGRNFPLLISTLADNGVLCFFGATGLGLKGEYKQTFFYDRRRFVMDARWVWMRQKQIVFRHGRPGEILSEIGLPPGRRGLVWGADAYALDFVEAALDRSSKLAAIASVSQEQDGIVALEGLGVHVINRDLFELSDDMPDPLTEDGTPNTAYASEFMSVARALGRAIWRVFGPRVSPDFIVERPDQSTLHYSSFLLRDYDERDVMPSGFIVARGSSDLAILGSHMYRGGQARDTVRLLAANDMVIEQDDLEIGTLAELPDIQQKMLDGTMSRPKGVALVQADRAERTIADYENEFLGQTIIEADPSAGQFLDIRCVDEVAIITVSRPDVLNALNEELVSQLASVVEELAANGRLRGEEVRGVIVRGAGRAFVAGADIEVFVGKSAHAIERLANDNMAVFTGLENLTTPVVSVVDGFALGGGNELAMSTHYRIVTENAALGQPEVKLGIMPGYGGMQRLPRLVGPAKAAELAVNGESIDGREAVRIGLAHELHASSTALARAFQVVGEVVTGRRELLRPDWRQVGIDQREDLEALLGSENVQHLLESPAPDTDGAGVLGDARRYAASTALRAIEFGYENGFAEGLRNDARLFGEVVTSPSGQHWIGRFLAKDPEQGSFLALLAPSG